MFRLTKKIAIFISSSLVFFSLQAFADQCPSLNQVLVNQGTSTDPAYFWQAPTGWTIQDGAGYASDHANWIQFNAAYAFGTTKNFYLMECLYDTKPGVHPGSDFIIFRYLSVSALTPSDWQSLGNDQVICPKNATGSKGVAPSACQWTNN